MTTKVVGKVRSSSLEDRKTWIMIGLTAAILSAAAVLLVHVFALSTWPELAAFKPLESYSRSVLFTLIPAFIATGLFAYLLKKRSDPAVDFLKISFAVLLVSFIPDFLLPFPERTLLGSSVAAFLHLVAAIIIVTVILTGYRRVRQAKP